MSKFGITVAIAICIYLIKFAEFGFAWTLQEHVQDYPRAAIAAAENKMQVKRNGDSNAIPVTKEVMDKPNSN